MSAPHSFTLRQLQYAVAVAETGGFRRAAERCHVAQPSLSAQLAQLESALGARLFERDRRKVLPTRAGEALLARARRVLAEADDLATAARQLGDPLAGRLRVGVIPTVAPYLLPEVAPVLRKKLPRLTLLWLEDRTKPLLAALRDGRLDAALVALVPGMEDLAHAVVREDPFVIAGPAAHPLLSPRKPAAPGELRGEDVLLLEDGHCLRDQALAVCSRARAHESEFQATSLSTLARMAAGGAGVTLLPSIALAVENRRGELAIRKFADPAPGRTLVLAWRKGTALADTLHRVAGEMEG